MRYAPTTPIRTLVRSALSVLGFVALVAITACSDDKTATQDINQLAPTRADLEAGAGLKFPSKVTKFRVVRISGSIINVSFTTNSDDAERFASDSGITLIKGKRVIKHASPVWDLNQVGDERGATDTYKSKVIRDVEIVNNKSVATVRIALTSA